MVRRCTLIAALALALGCTKDDSPADDSPVTESGDGEPDCCQSDSPTDYPDCVASANASATTTVEGAFSGLCTVTSVESGPPAVIALDCPMGPTTLTIETEPAWMPTLAVDTSVLAVYEDDVGGAKGDGWSYRMWQLRDPDTDAVLLAYEWGEILTTIDDFLTPTAIESECPMVCEANGFDGLRRAAVRFSDGTNDVTLFQGHAGTIGSYDVWVGNAYDIPNCSADQFAGLYEWFAAAAP